MGYEMAEIMKMNSINVHLLQQVILLFSFIQILAGEPCSPPRDGQCPKNCYYVFGGECMPCVACPKERLGHPEYHKRECNTFPYFCGGTASGDHPTDYTPIDLPEPHGVFSGNDDRWLLLFFQRTCPTVAKLCMQEYKTTSSQDDWYTLQSACLNITGADGTKYDRLEGVTNHSYNASQQPVYFITASYTDDHGGTRSAVIWVDETILKKVFKSRRYLEDPDSDERSLEEYVPSGSAIDGYCGNIGQMKDKEKNFLREHPQMFDEVNATAGVTSNGSGFLFEGPGNFTTLDTVEKKAPDGIYHKVIFIGTEDGRLLKLVSDEKMTIATLVEENYLTDSPTLGILDVVIVVQNRDLKLNVTTTDGYSQILPTESCRQRNDQCQCELDPFCYFKAGSCKPFDWNRVRGTGGTPTPKVQCVGDVIPDTLIVDPFGRSITTTMAAEGVTTPGGGLAEVGESSKGEGPNQGQGGTTDSAIIWIILGVVVAILVLVVAAILGYHRSKRHGYGKVPTDNDIERTWTTISLVKKFRNWGDTFLRVGEDEIRGTEENGKIVFRGLMPKTEYKIACNGRLIPYSTSGPVFGRHVLGKDSYSVEVRLSDWEKENMNAFISLRNGETGFSKRKVLDGSSFHLPCLPPNMSFEVVLVLETKDRSPICEKKIENVATAPEEFTITDDKKLAWSSLSGSVQRLSVSCCQCVYQVPLSIEEPHTNQHVTLPVLPYGVTCLFTIKGGFKHGDGEGRWFESVIGTVKHDTPNLVEVAKPSGSFEEVQMPSYQSAQTTSSDRLGSADSGIRSDASISDLMMAESDSNSIQLRTIHCHAGSSSDESITREPSSSTIGPLRSSDSAVQLENREYPCSKTMEDIMRLPVEMKQQISMRLRLSELMFKAFCEVLGYTPLEQDVFYQGVVNGDDALRPLLEREGQLGEVAISILLLKFMKCLESVAGEATGDPKDGDIDKLHRMVEYLVRAVHKDGLCSVCGEIKKSCDHLVKCRWR